LQQALEDVRAGQSDESVLLMNTAKWIVQTIRSMDKISCP
jgi:hypothetical protein